MSVKEKVLASLFQSITARTAGFNTVPISSLSPSVSFILMLLMFTGASSGSCGGGIKTNTLSTLAIYLRSVIKGGKPNVFSKTLPEDCIRRAIVIFTGALMLVSLATFLILTIEGNKFSSLDIGFEVVSAFGTVGLSRGITQYLSPSSLIILCSVMFAGRVGLINLAYVVRRREEVKIEFPEESILIG